jgi:cystathionine beta-lyase/cystathionine gamma-synthase
VPSGLSAITSTLLSVLRAGDHLLVSDSIYRPSRTFCDGLLARFGVETSYFDPLAGAGIAALFRPNTAAVMVEAPGSQTFEMPDIPAISAVAHARGALVIDDNTWASPLYRRALEQGVDALLNALTLFGMGYSWGGFESLIIPFDCDGYRTATQWAPGGPALRLHIGLENVEDLKADLELGFAAFNATQA